MISFRKTDGRDKDFRILVDLLDSDLNSRYGTLQEEYNKYNSLDSIKNVLVAYLNNEVIGCGSFKLFDNNTIEIKRMFLKPENRGSGVAANILHKLERWGTELGFSNSILETGIGQPEAIRFYQKNGYTIIENFGQYIGNLNSVCMGKKL